LRSANCFDSKFTTRVSTTRRFGHEVMNLSSSLGIMFIEAIGQTHFFGGVYHAVEGSD
jgi:hypothetical protein